MKEWVKKYWLWLLVALAFIVGGPIIINELYKTGNGYMTLWGASDVLSYYGMILAAAGAAIGVFFSIRYSHRQYEDDRRNRVLPYIAVTKLKQSAKHNLIDNLDNEPETANNNPEYGYHEYRVERAFFVICKDKIEVVTKLDNVQQYMLEHFGSMWTQAGPNAKAYIKKDMLSLPLEVENVGNGTAVNFRASLYKKGSEPLYMLPQAIKNGMSIYLHIFSSTEYKKIKGEYTLDFRYEDIYGNRYCQKHSIAIGIDPDKGAFSSMELYGKQELVKEVHKDTAHADT